MGDGILDGYPIIQDQTSPNLAHIPTTNEITYSEDFSQWSLNDVTLESGYASPDGGNNAWKVTNVGANAHLVGYSGINTNKHKSIYARTVSGTGYVYLLCRTGNASALYNLNENWQRFDMQHIGSDFFYAVDFRSTTDLTEILLFGAQLEAQSQATAYLKSDGIASVRKATTTNLVTYSEDFSQSFWTKSGASVSLDTTVTNPNGSLNSYKLVESVGLASHFIQMSSISFTSTNDYTMSVFAKSTERYIQLLFDNSPFPNGTFANFDLITGVVGTSNGCTTTITTMANGWYRCTITATSDSTTSAVGGYLMLQDNSSAVFSDTYTGNGTSGVYIWGSQLEQQTQVETYAPTYGLPVTIDLFTENNYGTMTNMSASDIVEDTPNN